MVKEEDQETKYKKEVERKRNMVVKSIRIDYRLRVSWNEDENRREKKK